MNNYSELKWLAENATPGEWSHEQDNLYFYEDGYTRHMMELSEGSDIGYVEQKHNSDFIAAANPEVILELIAEVEALKDQLECADEQVVFLEKQVKHLIQESLSIKKDADRYRTIKKDAISDGSLIERLDCNVQPSQWDSYIDSVSDK